MCYPARLVTILLVLAALTTAVQKTVPPASSVQRDYLPAGPFLFEPGTIHPTYMDAFDARPVVASPDGKLAVTVTGPKESYEAWVTIAPSAFPDGPVQVWPIQRSVDVLWRPDSQAFALTDNRYANLAYVLVFGTSFRMGESEPGLGVPTADLTPLVRKALEVQAQKYYAGQDYDTPQCYAKALQWVGNDDLLVGVSARTVGPSTFADRGIREWFLGYVVDVASNKVVDQLSQAQLLSQYKIQVAD